MIKLKIADPVFPELLEFRRLCDEFKNARPDITFYFERECTQYATARVSFVAPGHDGPFVFTGIYPLTPNAAVAQVKADIMAFVFGARHFGLDVDFIDSQQPAKEKFEITKTRLSSCVSIKQLVSILEEANHEKLPAVLSFIESKRASGGRPSKKSVVDMIFSSSKPPETRRPARTGVEWARVKAQWKDKFADSKFSSIYKSLDEFCTFATDQECQQ